MLLGEDWNILCEFSSFSTGQLSDSFWRGLQVPGQISWPSHAPVSVCKREGLVLLLVSVCLVLRT